MKKLSIFMALIIFFSFTLVGCAKVVSKETIEVEATVVEKDYDKAYTTTTFMHTGKTLLPMTQHHPADWDITLKYEDITENWDVDENIYNQYEVGDTIKCHLTTTTYSNGNIQQILTVIN